MADETAALVVALSAQLTKFEKDLQQAVRVANKHTTEIEDSFSRMNAAISRQLNFMALGFAGRLGAVGTTLAAIGPVGLTVAAAMGVLAAGFLSVTEKVEKFAEKARDLREAAEVTGLTTAELKALGVVGQKTGLDFEQTEKAVTKLALAVQELRTKGSGPLFDILLKVNPELVRQVAAAKDVAAAIDILSAAMKRLSQQQQLELSSAIGGRRNLGIGQILRGLPEGGVTAAAADAINKGFDTDLIERVAKLRQEIEAIQKRTDNIWGSAFSVGVLTAQKQTSEFWLQIAQAVERTAKAASPGVSSFFESISRGAQKALDAGRGPVPVTAAPVTPVERGGDIASAVDAERERRLNVLKSEIEIMKSWTKELGEALSPQEKLLLKEKELEVAGLTNIEVRKIQTRALTDFTLQQELAAEAIRERLGIATEEQIVQGRLTAIQVELTRGTITSTQAIKAETLARKEAKEAADALAVRLSNLPELTRFSIDAANTFKQLDQFAVSTFSNFENSIADAAVGTKTLSEAFKSMADSIIRDLIRITLRMSVTGPLAQGLAGLFGGTAGGTNLFSGLFGGARQSGGPVSRGSAYVVGEHGPELFIPQSAGKVVPNSLSSGRGGGGFSVEINNFVAADTDTKQQRQSGPDGERLIIDIVKKAQASGQLDDVNRGRFGVRPQKVR